MNIIVVSGKADKIKKIDVSLNNEATVQDLKTAYAKLSKKSIHRLSFKIGDSKDAIRLDDDKKSLTSYGIKSGASLNFKDLGPQIGYRLVFIVEYLGPLLFVLFYASRPAFIYGANAATTPYNPVAYTAIVAWCIHFLKREFETLFIHKFSRPTMPLNNLFKNCAYYWAFGAFIGYPLCSPSFVAPSEQYVNVGLATFAIAELGNLLVHIQLSTMREAEGSQKREIPKGLLFSLVACPNYTFEVLSWVGFSIMTQIPFSYAFTLVGFLQMADWAQKKHRGYKKTFEKEYTKLRRKAIVPFIY